MNRGQILNIIIFLITNSSLGVNAAEKVDEKFLVPSALSVIRSHPQQTARFKARKGSHKRDCPYATTALRQLDFDNINILSAQVATENTPLKQCTSRAIIKSSDTLDGYDINYMLLETAIKNHPGLVNLLCRGQSLALGDIHACTQIIRYGYKKHPRLFFKIAATGFTEYLQSYSPEKSCSACPDSKTEHITSNLHPAGS